MILDDGREVARIDAGGMLAVIRRLGAMTLEGWRVAAELPLPWTVAAPRPALAGAARPAVVVTAGMGGSGIGGDLLRALLAPTSSVPVVSVRDSRLPAFVSRHALVFVCSYSGNTTETLAVYQAARDAGAAVVVVTSGGHLAERARAAGDPVVLVPAGLQPRAALAYLLMPMLRVTARLGLAGPAEADVTEAAALLDRLADQWGPAIPTAENPAKQLAARLQGLVPVVYASSPGTAPVAYRWKTQFNENAKVFAAWNVFPELSHNETVGWTGAPGAAGRFVVILRDRDDEPLVAAQVEATRALALGRAHGVEEVSSQGQGRLARLLSLVLFGDLVSTYLAILSGVDPTPVEIITAVKRRLAGA